MLFKVIVKIEIMTVDISTFFKGVGTYSAANEDQYIDACRDACVKASNTIVKMSIVINECLQNA